MQEYLFFFGGGDIPPHPDILSSFCFSLTQKYAPGTSVGIATDSGIGTLGEDTTEGVHEETCTEEKNGKVEANVSAMEKYYKLCYKQQKENQKLEKRNLKLKNWHLRNKIKLDELKAKKLGGVLSPYVSSSDSSDELASDSE